MYRVPYSTSTIEFDLLPGMRGREVASRRVPPVTDPAAAVERALQQPVGSPRWASWPGPGRQGLHRLHRHHAGQPGPAAGAALLEELEEAGVRDEDITLLCGIGMHRPSTPEEKVTKLGQAVVERYRVIDNEPRTRAPWSTWALTENGVPLSVHRAAYEADLLIATGIVEPHQYAGYSGGRKTVAVGAAGEAADRPHPRPAFPGRSAHAPGPH